MCPRTIDGFPAFLFQATKFPRQSKAKVGLLKVQVDSKCSMHQRYPFKSPVLPEEQQLATPTFGVCLEDVQSLLWLLG